MNLLYKRIARSIHSSDVRARPCSGRHLLAADFLLPLIAHMLSHAALLPSESLAQLLAVLHWLAQQSNQVTDIVTTTLRLVRRFSDTHFAQARIHTA